MKKSMLGLSTAPSIPVGHIEEDEIDEDLNTVTKFKPNSSALVGPGHYKPKEAIVKKRAAGTLNWSLSKTERANPARKIKVPGPG